MDWALVPNLKKSEDKSRKFFFGRYLRSGGQGQDDRDQIETGGLAISLQTTSCRFLERIIQLKFSVGGCLTSDFGGYFFRKK